MEAIECIVARVDPEVPSDIKQELIALMQEYGPVFSKNETDIGLTGAVMHRIDVADAQPTRQELRHQPQPAIEAIDKVIPEMLKANLIEPIGFEHCGGDEKGRDGTLLRGLSAVKCGHKERSIPFT